MMRKALTLVLVGVAVSSLTTCGGDASVSVITAPTPAAGGETKDDRAKILERDMRTTALKLAFNRSEKHPRYLTLSEMSDAFYEATDGAYRIEISPNELLGSQKDASELVQSGTIQMAMVVSSIVENVNPDFAILGLPYVYGSVERRKKVLTNGALNDIFASTEVNNFSIIATLTAGTRCIYTDKSVQTPTDLKGYKIHVVEPQICTATLDAMDGVGTPMTQGEIYIAIQQGVINGGESNEITYADLKHYEAAPCFSCTCHLTIPDLLVMNIATLKGMSEEDQQILKDLCKKYTERKFQLWDENLEGAKNTAGEASAQFIDVNTVSFRETCQPAVDSATSKSEGAKTLYEEIRSPAN